MQELLPLAILLLRSAGEPQRAAFHVDDLRLHFALERFGQLLQRLRVNLRV